MYLKCTLFRDIANSLLKEISVMYKARQISNLFTERDASMLNLDRLPAAFEER